MILGYGNLAPKSRHGRILDVIYGLIGIPFNGIIMVQMGEYFGSVVSIKLSNSDDYSKNVINYS